MEVVNIKWLTVSGDDAPSCVEVTLASGRVVLYRPEGS